VSRRRAPLLRDEIVRVAAVCFGEVGYRATTLDTVAARAGVSKVTLYKYATSKEDLLWAVFARTIAEFRRGLGRIVARRLPADETLRRIVRYQVGLLTSHLPFLRVFFRAEGDLAPRLAARVARAKREYDRTIERVVRQGIREGRVRSLPPTILVFGVLGMTNWLHTWYRPDGRLAPDEIAAIFVDLLERGYLRDDRARAGADLGRVLGRIDARLAALEGRLALGQPRRRERKVRGARSA
jgi:AcrR family transcriptional regulator